MDQSLAKRTLQELIKRDDLKNKTCVDCGNPNPQWASLRFAISFRSFSATRCPIVHPQLRRIYLLAMRWDS
jgi:ADP-ribosylation factor GTPase-activating protein 1